MLTIQGQPEELSVQGDALVVSEMQKLDIVELKDGIVTDALKPNDIAQVESAEILPSDQSSVTTDESDEKIEDVHLKKAKQILQIVESYGVNFQEKNMEWEGFNLFLPMVQEQVSKSQRVRMILPAFPMKSPNRKDKVLGRLPDFGEELALHHLNGLCENINDIYENGAELLVQSDGLVYNDILGVSDEDVWDYGETLRAMAAEKQLKNLQFVRLWDLLRHPGPDAEENAKEFYLAHASCLRRELLYRYEPNNLNVDEAIRNEEDTCLTYRGYLKFLAQDLAHHPEVEAASKKGRERIVGQIARQMIARGKSFAAAVKDRFPECIRLSIHDSAGKGKLSMSLIPQKRGAGIAPTPWHSVVAVGQDGSYRVVSPEDVRDTHDLIYQNGRPSFYREKAEMFRWPFPVRIEHQYPTGVIITPTDVQDTNPPPSIREIPAQKVRALSKDFSPVVLRGFRQTLEEDLYVEKGHELGDILPWTFGIIQKVKDAGRTDKMGNNVTSNEGMPMHFDGMFKFKDEVDPTTGETHKVQDPPGYQYFTSLATAPPGTGYTLFASSRLFWRYVPSSYPVERLEKARWGMDNNGFWDAKIKDLPLVVRHPVDNSPCLRWHQPWDETKTRFSTCVVTIENDTQEIASILDQLLYDRRVCSYFTWNVGDLLISDNTAMLHTRTGYKTNCARELWRIHFN